MVAVMAIHWIDQGLAKSQRLKSFGSDGIRGSCVEFLQIRPAGICPADFKTSTNCYEEMEPLIERNREMLAGFAEIAAVA